MNTELTITDIAPLVRQHGRIVVCLIVRAQGSIPRQAGARMAVLPDGTTVGTIGGGLFESQVAAAAAEARQAGQSVLKKYDFREIGTSPDAFGAICGGQAEVFLEVLGRPDEILVVGGGHCGQALAHAAALVGSFQVVLLEDRPDFSDSAGLPGSVTVVPVDEQYAALAARVGPSSYVALVSRGAATDEAALRAVIGLDAPYLGMMGSRRKARLVLENLRRDGVDPARLARVHTPIGLEIGAETPAEIAISILSQIIAVRAGLLAAQSYTEEKQN